MERMAIDSSKAAMVASTRFFSSGVISFMAVRRFSLIFAAT